MELTHHKIIKMITINLEQPIQVFNKTLTKLVWKINYPDNLMYYQLQTDEGILFKEGNWIVPNEVIEVWGTDDNVINNAILIAKPWEL